MNTPSHHRVHHATNPIYLDRNYAGVFIVWDRMLGTFQAEQDEDEQIRYGIVRQLGSFNLLWSVFHEWVGHRPRCLVEGAVGEQAGPICGARRAGATTAAATQSDTIRERWAWPGPWRVQRHQRDGLYSRT
jgi:hypothetical protein